MTVIGLLLVLGTMGQVRDNQDRRRGDIARTGLMGIGIVVVFAILTATVLPATLAWGLILACVLIGGILMVTG